MDYAISAMKALKVVQTGLFFLNLGRSECCHVSVFLDKVSSRIYLATKASPACAYSARELKHLQQESDICKDYRLISYRLAFTLQNGAKRPWHVKCSPAHTVSRSSTSRHLEICLHTSQSIYLLFLKMSFKSWPKTNDPLCI